MFRTLPFILLLTVLGCGLSEPVDPDPIGPVDPPPTLDLDYDLFVIAGQSNARGRGDSLRSPEVPLGVGYEFLESGELLPMADPVVGAITGSAWPAFVVRYYEETGRGVILASGASGSSAQHPASNNFNGNAWQPDGGNYNTGLRVGERALQAATEAGLQPRFAGWLWIQGETDALALDGGRITVEDYEMAFREMLAALRTDLGPTFRLYAAQTGSPRDTDTPGFAAIRAAQARVCAEVTQAGNAACTLGSTRAVTFRSLGWFSDWIHWSQDGLNAVGDDLGVAVATVLE